MWRILDEAQPIELLDWRQAKLVAIVTDRSVPEVMGPVQYLRGTKIKHAIRCVYADLWPQLFSDVSCIALWISSEKILTRLYSVLHWFHKRLEANVKNLGKTDVFKQL